MSNSKLVTHINMSPNYTPMTNKKNKRITIHHMAGNISVETCGNIFAKPSRRASSNYGIDSVGRVGLYVDESNRAWTSSSYENDSQAVTIEVANCGGEPNWPVSDTALAKLIDLCVDICQRNGIDKLVYTGDTKGNMTLHKWFAATGCPGPYLESKMEYIAEQVNAQLKKSTVTDNSSNSQINSFLVKITANSLNIRKGPSVSYGIAGQITDKGVYTIVEVKNNWGKLKSGAGWISLKYTKRI